MHRHIGGGDEQRTKRDRTMAKQVTKNKRILQQQNGARQSSTEGVGHDARDNDHSSETNAVANSHNMDKRESKILVFGTKAKLSSIIIRN